MPTKLVPCPSLEYSRRLIDSLGWGCLYQTRHHPPSDFSVFVGWVDHDPHANAPRLRKAADLCAMHWADNVPGSSTMPRAQYRRCATLLP